MGTHTHTHRNPSLTRFPFNSFLRPISFSDRPRRITIFFCFFLFRRPSFHRRLPSFLKTSFNLEVYVALFIFTGKVGRLFLVSFLCVCVLFFGRCLGDAIFSLALRAETLEAAL